MRRRSQRKGAVERRRGTSPQTFSSGPARVDKQMVSQAANRQAIHGDDGQVRKDVAGCEVQPKEKRRKANHGDVFAGCG